MSKAEHASTTRRSLLADVLALSSAAGASAILVTHGVALADPVRLDEHEDAVLLGFEAPIVALAQITAKLLPEMNRLDDTAQKVAGPRPEFGTPEWPAYVARRDAATKANGFDAVQQAWETADFKCLDAIRVIEKIPARTFDGLRMKARMVQYSDDDLIHSIVEDLIAIDKAMRG